VLLVFLAFHDDANKDGVVSVLLLTPWYINSTNTCH
jgi:hypothetical protein